ncbi:MAG: hypothetical protein KF906_08035 [Actinobacteria bacterium]|nr:hypothetical protein [Actinomycetota bacterium]
MGFDVDRWLKYAKARFDAAIGSGNRRLDELEAEREADRADMPWLTDDASDAVAPSMDQVRARIEWEAKRQGVDAPKGEGGVPDRPVAPPTVESPATPPATTPPVAAATGDPGPLRSPQEQQEDAEREMARLELEARQKASAERLDDIRKELGVDAPPEDPPSGDDGTGR